MLTTHPGEGGGRGVLVSLLEMYNTILQIFFFDSQIFLFEHFTVI